MKMPERRTPRARTRARRAPLCMAVLAAVFGGSVPAAPVNYQLELVALRSDNINLSEDNQVAETVFSPRLQFDVKEEGSAIELQARGDLERRHYSSNRFPDETRSQFAGQLNWSLLPERLSFVVEDYLSEQPINIRDGRYPGNLQQVNVFLAGPTFYARLGDATRLRLDLRAADTYAEESPGFDSRRYSVAAALQRELTRTSRASLNITSTKVEFDDPTTTVDYKRHDGFIRYEGRRRNVDYQLDLGRSRLDRVAAPDASTSIVRATAQWQISSRSRLRFRGRHQFADEVQDLIVRLSDPEESLVPDLAESSSSFVTGGVFRQRALELDYRFTGERFGLRVRPMHRQLRYIDQPDSDRDERGASVQVNYRLQPTVNVFATGSVRDRDFLNRDEEHRDRIYGIGIDRQLNSHWGVRAEALRNHRGSNVPDARYRENTVQLAVWWKR